MNEVINTILKRAGVKEYADTAVEREKLEVILHCGEVAPNAMNKQTWKITALTDREKIAALDVKILEAYAKYKGFHAPETYHAVHGAPVLVIVSAAKDNIYRFEDCACANENMAIAAASLGLASRYLNWPACYFNAPEGEADKLALNIPEDYETVCFLSLGYPADPDYKPTPKQGGKTEILP